ncbi:MAG TPA: hypothetical protein VI298_17325 [Geobacteraceae bacterium]
MKNIIKAALLTTLLLTACAPVPKNRQEFISAVSAGSTFTRHESFASDKGYDKVVALMQKKCEQCLDVTVKKSMMDGAYLNVSRSIYLPSFVRNGNSAEFTLRVKYLPRPTREPDGGIYLVAADIAKSGTKGAQIDLYGPDMMGYGGMMDAIRGWLAGNDLACPKLH